MSNTLKIKEIIAELEKFAPLAFQEDYDNAGLITGDRTKECSGVLLTIDTTEEVVDEAIKKGINLIISHHPIVFSGLKKITGKNYIERTIILAIKNDIAIYAAHTNLDNVQYGVNAKIAEKLGLKNCSVLLPAKGKLKKIVTFIPVKQAKKVQEAVFEAGAGCIGNYDSCGYNLEGKGSFRADESANPFVGNKGEVHFEKEIRFETVFPAHLQSSIVNALLRVHPYEEVAYDIYSLDNEHDKIGAGLLGELDEDNEEKEFLKKLKEVFKVPTIRHTHFLNKKI